MDLTSPVDTDLIICDVIVCRVGIPGCPHLRFCSSNGIAVKFERTAAIKLKIYIFDNVTKSMQVRL